MTALEPGAGSVPTESVRPRRRTRRHTGRWLVGALALLLLALLLTVVLVGLDALRAQASLRQAADAVGTLRGQVLEGDRDNAEVTMSRLQDHSAEAVADTHGPHWWVAARLPVIGPTVSAVQTVSEVVDGLATGALPALSEATAVLDPAVLVPRQGTLELRPFIDVAPHVLAADDEIQEASLRLRAIDTERLLDEVAGPVSQLRGLVDEMAVTTATASRAVQLMPSMLGAYGERRYVLVAQNNAEARATGGILGAWIELTASNGTIALGEQYAAGAFNTEEPVVALTEEEMELFTERIATFGANPNMTPDFPRSAEIVRAMWEQAIGQRADGVVSVDPVVLQHILRATEPVTLSDGRRLDGESTARVLLNDIYVELADTAAQDEIFNEAARLSFQALIGGGVNPSAVIPALARSADEGRLLVWSADPREQALLSGTVLSGELRGDVDGAPLVGVYLNDASATKMSYYLDTDVALETTSCAADGSREATVRVDMASTAPPEASEFPPYLSGRGWLTPGDVVTNVLVYAPSGGRIDGVRVDGSDSEATGYYTHDGLEVAVTALTLSPAAANTLEVDIALPATEGGTPLLRVTPGAHQGEFAIDDSQCEM